MKLSEYIEEKAIIDLKKTMISVPLTRAVSVVERGLPAAVRGPCSSRPREWGRWGHCLARASPSNLVTCFRLAVRCNVEPPDPMKTRKRALGDETSDCQPATKQRRLQPEFSLPTLSPIAASTNDDPSSQPPKAREQANSAQPPPKSKPLEWAFEDVDSGRASASKRHRQSSSHLSRSKSFNNWLQDSWESRSVQEKAKVPKSISTTETRASSRTPTGDSQAADDQASQQDGEVTATPSTASTQSERLNISSPMYRGTLKMNSIHIDKFGMEIPQDVQDLVDKYIRKQRPESSPPLGEAEKTKIRTVMSKVWEKAEAMVSEITMTDLFPLDHPDIAEGRDTLWSIQPVPRNNKSRPIATPKPDRHYGFPLSQDSTWPEELLIAGNHPEIRQETQPTRENLLPSFIIEIKSDVTGGTSYGGENQVASAGAHRVKSMIQLRDRVDPKRVRTSADAIVFSSVVTQRGAVEHVHYFNVEQSKYCMSWVDEFSFLKDAQGCRNYHKNIQEWLVDIQQLAVKDLLTELYPISKTWKKGRSASTAIDGAETSKSDGGRSAKNQRT